jgi:hypothetical protein
MDREQSVYNVFKQVMDKSVEHERAYVIRLWDNGKLRGRSFMVTNTKSHGLVLCKCRDETARLDYLQLNSFDIAHGADQGSACGGDIL